jgi:hypothetical protein
MLHAQSVVDLLLKLGVRTDLLGWPWKSIRFHREKYRLIRLLLFRVRSIFRYYLRGDARSLFRDSAEIMAAVKRKLFVGRFC